MYVSFFLERAPSTSALCDIVGHREVWISALCCTIEHHAPTGRRYLVLVCISTINSAVGSSNYFSGGETTNNFLFRFRSLGDGVVAHFMALEYQYDDRTLGGKQWPARGQSNRKV